MKNKLLLMFVCLSSVLRASEKFQNSTTLPVANIVETKEESMRDRVVQVIAAEPLRLNRTNNITIATRQLINEHETNNYQAIHNQADTSSCCAIEPKPRLYNIVPLLSCFSSQPLPEHIQFKKVESGLYYHNTRTNEVLAPVETILTCCIKPKIAVNLTIIKTPRYHHNGGSCCANPNGGSCCANPTITSYQSPANADGNHEEYNIHNSCCGFCTDY